MNESCVASSVSTMVIMTHPVVSVARLAAAPAVSFLSQKAAVMATTTSSASSIAVSPSAIASVVTPAVSSAALIALRGGGGIASVPADFDLGRVRLRLDGLHSYGVVTTLLLNASLRLFSSTPKKLDKKNKKLDNYAKILFTMTILTSVMSGAYTTIVFSLLGLYSKSALGRGQDLEYLQFFDATFGVRKLAFDCFVISLLSFIASFVLSLFLNFEGKMRWWVAGIALVIGLVSINSWWSILDIAGKLIFSKA